MPGKGSIDFWPATKGKRHREEKILGNRAGSAGLWSRQAPTAAGQRAWGKDNCHLYRDGCSCFSLFPEGRSPGQVMDMPKWINS